MDITLPYPALSEAASAAPTNLAAVAIDFAVAPVTVPFDLVLAAATPAGMIPQWLELTGVIAAAALAAAAVLAGSVRARAAAMLGALVVSPLLLLAEVWDSPQVSALTARPALVGGALVVGLAAVAVLAVIFARRPNAFALAAAAALPFRVPIELGGTTANLLLPLYLVVGAGALGWAIPRLRRSNRGQEDKPAGWLERLLLGSVVLYAVQAVYSTDPSKALSQVVFFYVPFAVLFAQLKSLHWSPRLLGQSFAVLVGLALIFAAIGFVEYATREVLFNPKVIASNQMQEYFRVNSLFFDPSIYGRFLAVVMLGLAALLIWSEREKVVLATTAGLVILAGGLLLTLSQSSFAALLAGLGTLALLRWPPRWILLAGALVVATGVSLVLFAPSLIGVDLTSRETANRASSGRLKLIDGGVKLVSARPLIGWGSGSFEREYRRVEKVSSPRASAASHTIPVTIAAEQGVFGLALYFAFLAVALRRLLAGARRDLRRAAIAAAFVALTAHTWMYAAFLEDAMAWALLAVGATLAAAAPPPIRARQRERRREPVPVG